MSTRTSDLIEDRGEDFKFPRDFGHNVTFTWKGEIGRKQRTARLKSVIHGLDEGKPRQATLELSSWAGISIGAVHHYAKIDLGYPRYVFAANGKNWGYGVGGSNPRVPFGVEHVVLEVMRRSDKRDVVYDKEQHEQAPDNIVYGRRKLGDWTYQFWSEQEARDAAVSFFLKHFAEGWVLLSKYYDGDSRPLLATTQS